MKLLIFSDSHGNDGFMKKAVDLHPDAEAVFHLGDGMREFLFLSETDRNKTYFCVRGNCDLGVSDSMLSSCVEIGGVRFFLTHGHLYLPPVLTAIGEKKNADAILFGHTHRKYEEYLPEARNGKGMYLFNPGSISRPRDPGPPSYGVAEIRGGNILFSHGTIL